MTDRRRIAEDEDPVCGMTVDREEARERACWSHDGTEYVFCGKGCFLEFRDAPDRFLEVDYQPSM